MSKEINTTTEQGLPDELQEQSQPKSNQWVKGMKSPNPTGRPKGIVDRRLKWRKLLEENADAIFTVVKEAALEKDMHAASLILSRLMPPLKPRDDHVEFDLDTSAPLGEQVEQVLKAMSEGNVSPDTAKQVVETIGALDAIRQMEEIKSRLLVSTTVEN
jgi:hypothetical protein